MSDGISIVVDGLEKVLKQIGKAGDDYPGALAAAIYQKGFEVDADAVRLCPVDTGRLRASHYVAPPTGDVFPEVEVGFGTDYAVPVHERTENVNHTTGEALFLRKAIDKARSGYAEDIAQKTRENAARGIGVKSIPRAAPTAPKEKISSNAMKKAGGTGKRRGR